MAIKAEALGEVVHEEADAAAALGSRGGKPTPKICANAPKAAGVERSSGMVGNKRVPRTSVSVSTQGVGKVGVKGVNKEVPLEGETTKDPPEGGEWGRSNGAYPTATFTPCTLSLENAGLNPPKGAKGGEGRCPHTPAPAATVEPPHVALKARERVGRYKYPGYSVPGGMMAVRDPPLRVTKWVEEEEVEVEEVVVGSAPPHPPLKLPPLLPLLPPPYSPLQGDPIIPHWAEVTVSMTPLGMGLEVGLGVATPVSAKGRYKEVGERGTPRPKDTPKREAALKNAHTSATKTMLSKVELGMPTQVGAVGVLLLALLLLLEVVAAPPSLSEPLIERDATSPWDQGCPSARVWDTASVVKSCSPTKKGRVMGSERREGEKACTLALREIALKRASKLATMAVFKVGVVVGVGVLEGVRVPVGVGVAVRVEVAEADPVAVVGGAVTGALEVGPEGVLLYSSTSVGVGREV